MSENLGSKIVECARAKIGSQDWSPDVKRGSFESGEPKCNLFVAEVLTEAGFNVPLINHAGPMKMIFHLNLAKRPPTAKQWYDGECSNTELIQNLDNSLPGDVITDSSHMDIISGKQKTISASFPAKKVVENDFGWKLGQNVRIFRCKSS